MRFNVPALWSSLVWQWRRLIGFRIHPSPPDGWPYRVPAPREVYLELTTCCNMAPPCIACGRAVAPAATDWHHMDPAIWQRLLPLLRQVSAIGLHGNGEPLAYPHLFALLEYLDAGQSRIGFSTNGHLLTPENARRLIEQQVAWISISIDAASSEMYLRLRRRTDFARLLEKVRSLTRLKAQMGSQRPRVEISMVVMCTNLPEAPRFVELAVELGADDVMFQQLWPGGWWTLEAPDGYCFVYQHERPAHCPALHAQMMEQAWKWSRELHMPITYEIVYDGSGADWQTERVPQDLQKGRPVVPREALGALAPACPEPWKRLLVNVDGYAFFCCTHMGSEAVLGNVLRQPVPVLWNGPAARQIRRLLLEGAVPRYCKGCHVISGKGPSEPLPLCR